MPHNSAWAGTTALSITIMGWTGVTASSLINQLHLLPQIFGDIGVVVSTVITTVAGIFSIRWMMSRTRLNDMRADEIHTRILLMQQHPEESSSFLKHSTEEEN